MTIPRKKTHRPPEFYIKELQSYLNWALSNLNRHRDELIDVGFVIYLELYVKQFKQSAKQGRDFLLHFADVFRAKFANYIDKLLQVKFVDHLDQLFFLNLGYNSTTKYIIILSKNCKRVLLNWLNIYHNNVINVILLERVEFIDGEMFNHSSVNVFKRYFILKYGINPESIHKVRKPFLGLYIRDVELNQEKVNNLLIEPLKENKILFGLPCEIYSNDYGRDVNTYCKGINGEYTKMEDYRKLVPLPRPGSLIHDSLRSLFQVQHENRNLGLRPYVLSYNLANVSSINCSAVSDFDGRHVALGQMDGSILLWDLVKSQCENAYSDISCIVGKDIAVKSVNRCCPAYLDSTSTPNKGSGYESTGSKREYLVLDGHDGLVNCLKFGENGQVLLSAGIDSTINLYTVNTNSSGNSVKCVYYNSTFNNPEDKNSGSVMDMDFSAFGYYFTSCDLNGYCKLWSTDRSFPVRTLKLTSSDFLSSRFHPNSSLLSVISSDNKVHIHDLKSFSSVSQFVLPPNLAGVPTGAMRGMGWSKSGILLGVYLKNMVLLYDIRKGEVFETINAHKAPITSIDFSYSTSLLSVTDEDNEMSLWAFNNLNKYILSTDTTVKKNEKVVDSKPSCTKKLLKSYKFNKTKLLNSTFTPENVLIALGISLI